MDRKLSKVLSHITASGGYKATLLCAQFADRDMTVVEYGEAFGAVLLVCDGETGFKTQQADYRFRFGEGE